MEMLMARMQYTELEIKSVQRGPSIGWVESSGEDEMLATDLHLVWELKHF